jgi:hypothetical protein
MTRYKQINEALNLLAPTPEQRERCRSTIEWALDRMTAHVALDRPTEKARRSWIADLERIKARRIKYAAAGGDPWALPQKAIDRAILAAGLEETVGTTWFLPPWSKERHAVVLAHDLLSEWDDRNITISRKGKWYKLSEVLYGDGCPDLYRQLRHSLPDIRLRLEICGPFRVGPEIRSRQK